MFKAVKTLTKIGISLLMICGLIKPVQAEEIAGNWLVSFASYSPMKTSLPLYKALGDTTRENPVLTSQGGTYYLFTAAMNGEPVYCVEPQLELMTERPYTKLLTGAQADQMLMAAYPTLGLSAAQIQLMSQIASVGYGYGGDTSQGMQAATQLRIWLAKNPGGFFNYHPSLQAKLDLINDRLQAFAKPVSFAGQMIQLEGLGEEHAVVLEDTNQVFKHYFQAASLPGVHTQQDGSSLKLWIDESAPRQGVLDFYGLYEPGQAANGRKVYFADNNQLLAAFGKVTPPSMQIGYSFEEKIDRKSVSASARRQEKLETQIELLKTDGTTSYPISGAEFEFFAGGTSLGTATTNQAGKIMMPVWASKEFVSQNYVREYVENFDQLSAAARETLVAQGILKTKAEAQTAAQQQADQDVAAQVARWKDEDVEFKAVELKAAKGYYLDPEKQTQIVKSQQDEPITFEFENVPLLGAVIVDKTGESLKSYDTGTKENGLVYTQFKYGPTAMQGAEFELHAGEEITQNNEVIYKKDQLVDKLVTDEKGKASKDQLPLGKYYLIETKAPTGYVLDSTRHEVELTINETTGQVEAHTESLVNKRQKLDIAFNKTSSFGTPLADCKFGLYLAEDINVNGVQIKKGTLIEESTSDAKGNVTFKSDLPLALYEIKELAAPAGYELNEEAVKINGHTSNANQEINKIHAVMKNNFRELRIELIKVDSNTRKAIIDNPAEFGVYTDEALTKQIGTLKTEANSGHMLLSFDKPGIWYIKETKAPEGYLLSDKVIKMEVRSDGKLLINDQEWEDGKDFFVENTPLSETNVPVPAGIPSVPAKSGVLTRALAYPARYWTMAAGSLVIMAAVLYFKKRI